MNYHNFNRVVISACCLTIVCCSSQDEQKAEIVDYRANGFRNLLALSLLIDEYQRGEISSSDACKKTNILKDEIEILNLRLTQIKKALSPRTWQIILKESESIVAQDTQLMKDVFKGAEIIYRRKIEDEKFNICIKNYEQELSQLGLILQEDRPVN